MWQANSSKIGCVISWRYDKSAYVSPQFICQNAYQISQACDYRNPTSVVLA